MKLRALLAATVVLAMVTSAQAVQLVVMSVNNANGLADGSKTYTIGVKVSASDVTAPGVGNNPPLFAQNITFTGDGSTTPYQDPNGVTDVQGIQSGFIDPVVTTLPKGPPTNAKLTTSGGNAPLYQGSWWYASSGAHSQAAGLLAGRVSTTTFGVVTTAVAGGPWTIGPTNNVGSIGYVWAPQATGETGGAFTGDTWGFTGIFGPLGNQALNQAPLSAQFSGGFLTVPLIQLTVYGNTPIPDAYTAGTGTFLSVGQNAYDLSGAPAGTDTPLILNFATNSIQVVPEPATIALLGIGAIGLLLWRRRK